MRGALLAILAVAVGCGDQVASSPDLSAEEPDLAAPDLSPPDLAVPDLAAGDDLAMVSPDAASAADGGPDLAVGPDLATGPDLACGTVLCGATCCNPVHGTCSGGMTCLSCNMGWADCNNDPSDGCEADLTAGTVKKCGATCIATSTCCDSTDCASPPSPCQVGTCSGVGGTCSYALPPGVVVCSGVCCGPLPHAIAGCGTVSACIVVACDAGWQDCDKNPADGCEATCNGFSFTCGSACPTTCDPNDNTGCDAGHYCVGGTSCLPRQPTSATCSAGFQCASGTCDATNHCT